MKFMYFSMKHKFHLINNRLFCCIHTCYCVNMVSVTPASSYITSASCYHPRYQFRSYMYTRGLIPRNFAELVDAVPIWVKISTRGKLSGVPFRIAAVCKSVRDGTCSYACVCDPVFRSNSIHITAVRGNLGYVPV